MNQPGVFTSRQTVYWDMLDMLGVLHNARYIIMFERARFDFWSHLGLGPDSPEFDWPYLVVRNEINYLSPIRSEQQVTVTVAVKRIGNSSLTFAHRLCDENGTIAAEGETTLVRIDAVSASPISWSGSFKNALNPYSMDAS